MGKRLLLAICSLFLVTSVFPQQLKNVIIVDIPLNSSKASAIEKLKQKGFELKERSEKGEQKELMYVRGGGFYSADAMVTLTEKDKMITKISWGCSNIEPIQLELEEEMDLSPFYIIIGEHAETRFYHWKGKTIELVKTDPTFLAITRQTAGEMMGALGAYGLVSDQEMNHISDLLKFPHGVTFLSNEDAEKRIQEHQQRLEREEQQRKIELQQRYNDSLMALKNIDSIYRQVDVDEMPEFPGGDWKKMEYIAKNIKYPQSARESGIQGRVSVAFVVEPDGSVSNVEVLSGIGGGCDEELMRVVKSMPKWKPGKKGGIAVRVCSDASMLFKLQ